MLWSQFSAIFSSFGQKMAFFLQFNVMIRFFQINGENTFKIITYLKRPQAIYYTRFLQNNIEVATSTHRLFANSYRHESRGQFL
jgi:hypothetical protein